MERRDSVAMPKRWKVLDSKTYSIAEVGRLVGLHPRRVSRWLQGYEYSYELSEGRLRWGEQAPIVSRGKTAGTTYASFLDLVDLVFVRQFLEHGLSLQKVRKALDEGREVLGTNHFARESFFTDGRNILLELTKAGPLRQDGILQLMTGGQWTIASIIKQLATRIEFVEGLGFAKRWYPLKDNNLIVVDPFVSFGRPSITNRGVTTENVFDLYLGENKSSKKVGDWLSLNPKEVDAAIGFELKMAA
ncbi:MAG TPA: hypothetical protein VJP78_08290 [Thermoleophilia bacterium]|nr:hypothetical protein [Thermoleophilia bacterium]